jgi:hypothetical protein
LVRKSRDDRGGRRVVSPKIKAAIEALALESPPLPIRSIWRQVRQFAEATGEPLPRYGTVYDLVRDAIGMPGIEKRIARFPQFYSRIGFVHEFRPLDADQVQELLEQRWTPAGVTLPDEQLIPEVIASVTRMTGGTFRLLTRLLTQIERVLSVNDLHLVSNAVVEAARDSLVIGTS